MFEVGKVKGNIDSNALSSVSSTSLQLKVMVLGWQGTSSETTSTSTTSTAGGIGSSIWSSEAVGESTLLIADTEAGAYSTRA